MDAKKDSDKIKRELCDSCKNDLRGLLSDEQLNKFEEVFQKIADGYTFKRADHPQYIK